MGRLQQKANEINSLRKSTKRTLSGKLPNLECLSCIRKLSIRPMESPIDDESFSFDLRDWHNNPIVFSIVDQDNCKKVLLTAELRLTEVRVYEMIEGKKHPIMLLNLTDSDRPMATIRRPNGAAVFEISRTLKGSVAIDKVLNKENFLEIRQHPSRMLNLGKLLGLTFHNAKFVISKSGSLQAQVGPNLARPGQQYPMIKFENDCQDIQTRAAILGFGLCWACASCVLTGD